MAKIEWKPGQMLYPLPAVMVSCGDFLNQTDINIITVIYIGSVSSNPHQVYVSIRQDRHSYGIIKKQGEYVINLATENLAFQTDFCGVKSGRDMDKFKETGLTASKSSKVSAPSILECPVNIECKVNQIIPVGSHHMFIADVACVCVDEQYMDDKDKFHLDKAGPICYSHGQYYGLGNIAGSFGYSVRKKK